MHHSILKTQILTWGYCHCSLTIYLHLRAFLMISSTTKIMLLLLCKDCKDIILT